jgi:hypothetical protein
MLKTVPPPVDNMISQINPVHIFTDCFYKIHFNNTLLSQIVLSFPFHRIHSSYICTSHVPRLAKCPAHLILLDVIKAISLQAWTGPEGSRRLRLPDFKTIDT